jgi:rhodanese-related sulfurtransferase
MAWPFSRGPKLLEVDVATAYDLSRKGAKLIDVRTRREFAEGHPRGAKSVPPEQAKKLPKTMDYDAELLVICLSGHRSAVVVKHLMSKGFTNVVNVHGGFRAWQQSGLPIARSAR